VQCQQCQFIRADLDISEEALKNLYREDYFTGQEYGDYLADAHVHTKNFERRLTRLRQLSSGWSSIFEIGCAYGFWLDTASRHGIRCSGIDVCPEAVEYAAQRFQQAALLGDFLSLPMAPGQFDAFCMWDTIEHLAHPEQFIARVVELLPRGGWFFCTTGDIGSRVARRQGPRWRMIHPPTHLQYFSTDSLGRLLTRQGLDVVKIESTPMYRSLRGTLGGLSALSRGPVQKIAQLASRVVPSVVQDRVGFWLDLGDIMLAVARKP
jgi:SAM-dependent methyltransferase